MISYPIYKLVHYLGIFGIVALLAASSADPLASNPSAEAKGRRRRILAAHGVLGFVILLGGFGMLARLGITQGLSLPGWIWLKLVIWGMLGVVPFIARRAGSGTRRMLLIAVPLLATAAGIIALTKPL